MKKIKKALFPVAGMGTRMLPATKVVPKELLPVYITPILDILVEECINAGIEEIIFVTSREKNLIENYFDAAPELEKKLEKKGDKKRLERITKFSSVKFSSVRQGEQNGDGHAILCAKHLLKDEPFLVVFGDELVFGSPSSVQQLLNVYNSTGNTVVGVREIPLKDISAYGVVDFGEDTSHSRICGLVEKPPAEKAPSNKAIIGKYICTPEIWKSLESAKASHAGEVRLIDGFIDLLNTHKISACNIEGQRFDTGSAKGYCLASMYMAIQSGEISKDDILNLF